MGDTEIRPPVGKRRIGIQLPVALLLAALALSACGGGSGGSGGGPPPPPPPPTEVTISGTVQKGLFDSLAVTAAIVSEQNGSVGDPVAATITGQNFSVKMGTSSLVLLEASGSFTHDLNGTTVVLDEPLKVLVETGNSDLTVNINFATHLAAEMTLAQLAAAPQDATALIAANEGFVGDAFGFPDATDPKRLSLVDIDANSDTSDPNLLLLLYSAAIADSLTGDSLFADGFGAIAEQFVVATALEDVAIVLNQFAGINVQSLYGEVQAAGFNGTLPNLQLSTNLILDCPPLSICAATEQAEPTVTVGAPYVYEAVGAVSVPVRLSEPSTTDLDVRVFTSNVSAERYLDYVGIDRMLTFPAGTTQIRVEVPLLVDAVLENTETFSVAVESQSEAYANGSPASVRIRDGAPGWLENQDGSELVVLDICVKEIGIASEITETGCDTPLDPTVAVGLDPSVQAAVQIDLAATCAVSQDCAPQSKDWVVHFFLVADGGDELYLGPYVYANDSVQLTSEPPAPRNLLVSLGTPENAAFLRDALAAGPAPASAKGAAPRNALDAAGIITLEVRVDAPQLVTGSVVLPDLVPVPGSVVAGNLVVPLGAIDTLTPGDGTACQVGEYELTADFIIAQNVLGGASDSSASGTVCITIAAGNGTDPTATLVSGAVDLEGTLVNLAPGHNTRFPVGAPPIGDLPVGIFPGIAVIGAPSADPITQRYLLHVEGLPFMLAISGGELSPNGIAIEFDNARYVMEAGYSPQDPRARGELYSNDIVYSGLAGQAGTLMLEADGTLSGTINVAGGTDGTAFPKGQVQWTAFSQLIVNSRIADEATADLAYILRQSSACRGPNCSAGDDLVYGVSAPGTTIGADGFVLGTGEVPETIPVAPGWGADSSGNLAFERAADLAAPNAPLMIALPGYRFPDTASGRVTDYLLAHIEPNQAGLQIHPLGSDASEDGNFFPTGLTVGPETYADELGQPQVGQGQDLFGKPLTINNGSDVAALPSLTASKYVVRNGGITGVFNIDPAGLQTPLQYFGYSLELDRFAIRIVDNELDDYNWIDGSLTLYGDAGGTGGLELAFANLEMNCSARFDAAVLLNESCDAVDNNGNGIVDENCGHRLDSWRADTEIFSMGFDSGASCAAGSQLLTLEQQVFFGALDGPVGLNASWEADGTLGPYTSAVQSSYRLDEGNEKGFPIRAQSVEIRVADVAGADNGRYGWAELPETTVGVPFWNAIKGDVRVANTYRVGNPAPEPTVMAPAAQLGSLAADQTNADLQQAIIDNKNLDISARYQWGTTNFGFELPVNYSPQQFNSERPQFIGRRKETDLFVLEAGAGINFIDPERTKLSFGASADISKLKSVNLQLDLTDPENLGKVDDLLIRFKVVREPVLEPALQDLFDNLNIVNRLANRGLDELMQQGLELALEELGEAAAPVSPYGEDPFVTASKALAQVKSYPQQLLTILDDEVKGAVDDALQDQRGLLALKLQDLEDQVLAVQAGVAVPADVRNGIDDTIAFLESIDATIEGVNDQIDRSVGEVRGLVTQARDPLDRARSAITSIDQMLLQAVSFSRSACEAGDLAGQEASGYLDQVLVRIDSVQKIFAFIENDDILLPLTELLNNDPELRERIEQARRDIRTQAEELAGYLQDAEQAIRGIACNERYTELLADARQLLADAQADINFIDALLGNAQANLALADDIKSTIVDTVRPPVAQLLVLLRDFRAELDGLPQLGGAELLADLEGRLANLTDGRINKIVAAPDNNTETDILELVFDGAQAAINETYADIRGLLEMQVADRLGGAYYSPEQLRRLFVGLIMDSEPVADLRTTMNVYFSEINYRVNNLVLLLTDQLNSGIRAALQGVESEINDALDAAFAPVRSIPLESAKLDGFAVIAGNELERAHIGAEWTMSAAAEGQSANTFGAALDAVSWSASNKTAGCSIGEDSSRLDVTISALGLPANFIGSDITLKKLYLGFTLGSGNGVLLPRGVFGGISTIGEIGFSEALVYDPAFAAGIGDIETYIGASAGAVFSDLQAEVAFLVGRTCNTDILTELDPRIAEFITFPPNGFKGVYLRGGASIPLLTFGCPLTVGLGADFGAWVLAGPPTTFGGLVGGGAYGKVACIGALRGQLLAIGQVNTDGDLFFAGEGFGAAGAGWCDPETWTSVQRVRDDDYCGTGDAVFKASFDNGKWKIPKPSINAIH